EPSSRNNGSCSPRCNRQPSRALVTTGRSSPVRRPTVQARLDLLGIEAGRACFGQTLYTHALAVLDVVGADAALASVDDAAQEEILAGRAQFLNAQTAPFQIVVRAEPVDLEVHLRRVQARVAVLPPALQAIATDYLRFLPSL